MNNKFYDNIKIPSNIYEYVERGMDKAEKEIKLKNKKRKVIISTIASIVIVLITACTYNSTFAKDIPILKEIFKVLENSNLKSINKGNYSNYSKEVGITKESNGVKITIQEVVYDGNYIYLSYKFENKEEFPYEIYSYPTKFILSEDNIIIDGEEYVDEPITWMYLDADIKLSFDENNELFMERHAPEGIMVDNKTFIGIQRYEVKNTVSNNREIPNRFNLELNINKIYLPPKMQKFDDSVLSKDYRYSVEGNWNFLIPIEIKEELFKRYEINEEKEGFLLKSVIETPFSLTLEVIPLKDENKKIINNESDNGGKNMQLQSVQVVGSDGKFYGSAMPGINYSNFSNSNEVEGAMYCTINKLNENIEYYTVQVKDYTIENKNDNDNLPNEKIIEFREKVENTFK